VADICNISLLGGRDPEDQGLEIPSQLVARHNVIHLSFQPSGEAQIGGIK
jgi:hypothetical protein